MATFDDHVVLVACLRCTVLEIVCEAAYLGILLIDLVLKGEQIDSISWAKKQVGLVTIPYNYFINPASYALQIVNLCLLQP